MIDERFIFLGIACSSLAIGTYVKAVWQGRVQPNRLSWFLLGVAPLVAFAAELNEGVGLRSLTTLWVGLGPLLIVAVSFVNSDAYWKLRPFDLCCGSMAVLALVCWQATGSGHVAIALSIVADAFAFLPVFVKAWRFPHTEMPWGFAGGIVSSAIAILVVDRHTFADLAFPIYLFVACVSLVSIIVVRGHVSSRSAALGV